MFPDVAAVRDMQEELETIIRQGVQNITTLLKNSKEKTYLGTGEEEASNTEFEADSELSDLPLSERLVKEGVISESILKQLKEEMAKGNNNKEKE